MAGAGLRRNRRAARRARARACHRLHRLRPDGREPPCGLASRHHGARAHAALRPLADCDRRRRHGPDWRSERQERGTHVDDDRAGRGQRRSPARAALALSRFRRRHQPGAHRQQCRVADEDERDRIDARRRQVFHRELHAGEGVGEAAHRERRRDFVYRVQLPAPPVL